MWRKKLWMKHGFVLKFVEKLRRNNYCIITEEEQLLFDECRVHVCRDLSVDEDRNDVSSVEDVCTDEVNDVEVVEEEEKKDEEQETVENVEQPVEVVENEMVDDIIDYSVSKDIEINEGESSDDDEVISSQEVEENVLEMPSKVPRIDLFVLSGWVLECCIRCMTVVHGSGDDVSEGCKRVCRETLGHIENISLQQIVDLYAAAEFLDLKPMELALSQIICEICTEKNSFEMLFDMTDEWLVPILLNAPPGAFFELLFSSSESVRERVWRLACDSHKKLFEVEFEKWYNDVAYEKEHEADNFDDFTALSALVADDEFWPPELEGLADRMGTDEVKVRSLSVLEYLLEFISSNRLHGKPPAVSVLYAFGGTDKAVTSCFFRWMELISEADDICELSMCGCRGLDVGALKDCIYAYGGSFEAVKVLDLSGVLTITDGTLPVIGETMPNLECLSLCACKNITAEGLRLLGGALPRIGAIVDDREVLVNSLRKLNLRSCISVDDDALEVLAEYFCGVLDLCLYGAFKITDGGIVNLCNRSMNLRRINICGCYKCTDMARRFLFQIMPSLLLYNSPCDFGIRTCVL